MEFVKSSACDTGACVEVHRSSFCGGGECVEVHRSSFCESAGCVEIGYPVPDTVSIRNSTDPNKVISFTREEWSVFVKGVKAGEFDVD